MRLHATVLSTSVITVIVDGIDQAKFRVPRRHVRSHAFDRLLRPALHVQGIWAHGAGYQLAVSDTDFMKDTNNNCEVIARMLSTIYLRHGCLPLGLNLQQDNTSRECKNQKMVKFAAMLVAKGVFRWVTLSYLITGHTHTNLDATYGQLTVKLSHEEQSRFPWLLVHKRHYITMCAVSHVHGHMLDHCDVLSISQHLTA